MACSFNLEYLLVGGRDARGRGPPVLHVVRLDGRRLGRPQRQGRLELHLAGVRRRAGRPAAGGPGAAVAGAHHRTRDPRRLRRPGPLPRRRRRREGRHADPGRGHGRVLLLRPRARRSPGASTAACRRCRTASGSTRARTASASSGRSSPTCRSSKATSSPGPRPAAAASATRSTASRMPCARTSSTATSPSPARSPTTASSSSRSTPRSTSTRSTPRQTERARARIRDERVGWLGADAEEVAARYRERRAGRPGPRAPVRRDRRLGHRRAAAPHDRDVPRHAPPPRGRALGRSAGRRGVDHRGPVVRAVAELHGTCELGVRRFEHR